MQSNQQHFPASTSASPVEQQHVSSTIHQPWLQQQRHHHPHPTHRAAAQDQNQHSTRWHQLAHLHHTAHSIAKLPLPHCTKITIQAQAHAQTLIPQTCQSAAIAASYAMRTNSSNMVLTLTKLATAAAGAAAVAASAP